MIFKIIKYIGVITIILSLIFSIGIIGHKTFEDEVKRDPNYKEAYLVLTDQKLIDIIKVGVIIFISGSILALIGYFGDDIKVFTKYPKKEKIHDYTEFKSSSDVNEFLMSEEDLTDKTLIGQIPDLNKRVIYKVYRVKDCLNNSEFKYIYVITDKDDLIQWAGRAPELEGIDIYKKDLVLLFNN